MTHILHTTSDPLSARNDEQLVLYDGPASPCCRRCRITMLEKDLTWDTVYVNIGQMEQRSPEYLRLNPNGLVPTLRHGTRVLFESGVINDYLETQFPEVPLMPADARGIARVRQWQAAELAMARVFRPVMYAHVMGPIKRLTRTRAEAEIIARQQTDEPWDVDWELKVWSLDVLTETELAAHQAWLLEWLAPLEQVLSRSPYVLGEQLSQADVSLYPRIEMYPNAGLNIEQTRFPNLCRWMAELGQRPSFADSATEGLAQNLALSRSPELARARAFFQASDRDLNDLEDPELVALAQRLRNSQGVEALLAGESQRRTLPPGKDDLKTPAERPAPISASPERHRLSLYGPIQTPEQRRIVWLLKLLGLDYQHETQVPEDLTQGLDPNDTHLPVLASGDLYLNDPPAIAEYLMSLARGNEVQHPVNSYQRAEHAMWLALESGTHKEFGRLAQLPADDTNGLNMVRQRILWKLKIVERQLSITPYLCGARLSFADLTWHTRVDALCAQLGPVRDLELPALARWYERLLVAAVTN